VVLTLKPTGCATLVPPPAGCYLIGSPNSGIAYILDNDSDTNIPPVAKITSPANNTCIKQGVPIPVYAYAADRDDTVSTVEFFDGTTSLGLGKPVIGVTPSNSVSPICASCPPPISSQWGLVWSNAPLGRHELRALATDSRGATGLSDPVNILVVTPPPPSTNPPVPVINIFASDPIAIEGTNCWTRCVPTNWPASSTVGSPVPCIPTQICGPKNATFTVVREGNPTNDVTVSYAIGGTATNGVDYVAISNSVTIPAFTRSALVTIVPLDDGPPDLNSTVVLKLIPSAVAPPDYLLGARRSAAALIVDSVQPAPVTRMLPDQTFHLAAAGPDGGWFRVEYSTDMVNWTGLCTNQVFNGSVDFLDPDATADTLRLYRAVPLRNLP
jgi:hypothetical protein